MLDRFLKMLGIDDDYSDVTCKDCKWYVDSEWDIGNYECRNSNVCWFMNNNGTAFKPDGDFYCKYRERKQ